MSYFYLAMYCINAELQSILLSFILIFGSIIFYLIIEGLWHTNRRTKKHGYF